MGRLQRTPGSNQLEFNAEGGVVSLTGTVRNSLKKHTCRDCGGDCGKRYWDARARYFYDGRWRYLTFRFCLVCYNRARSQAWDFEDRLAEEDSFLYDE